MSPLPLARAPLIGGVFALPTLAAEPELPRREAPRFLHSDSTTLINARSAFHVLARTLRPDTVWLPSFLCDSVCTGFRSAGCRLDFFPVDHCLRCSAPSWIDRVNPGDLVLRIHYFGFLNTDPIYASACRSGAVLVDDAAQALLTDGVGEGAAAVVYSPRKFVGTPDGAFLLRARPDAASFPQLLPPPSDWWRQAFSAVQRRRDFDLGLPDATWFARFQEAEKSAPVGAYAMSELSRRLLEAEFDYAAIAATRRRNFLHLAQRLGNFSLFHTLPAEVVPLGFPVILENREEVRRILFREQIFPPVHWPVPAEVPVNFGAGRWLADRIMTLPCDQRYREVDMEAIIGSFLSAHPVLARPTSYDS
jgi:hypothetical protein